MRAEGAGWYDQALESCVTLSRQTGRDLDTTVRVVAAMSPRCNWGGTLTKAKRALEMPDLCLVSDMPSVMGNLRRVCRGEDFGPRSIKVRTFAYALAGDEGAVTVDVWMSRAFGGPDSPTLGVVRRVTQGVTRAAKILGLTPRTLQATIWVKVRG